MQVMRIAGVMIAGLVLGAVHAGASATPAVKCLDSKLGATAELADGLLRCHARAARSGTVVDPSCVVREKSAFDEHIAKAEDRGGCLPLLYPPATENEVDRFVDDAVAALVPGGNGNGCAAAKVEGTGERASGLLKAHGKSVRKGETDSLQRAVATLDAEFGRTFDRAEREGDCQTIGDEQAIRDEIDRFVDRAMSTLGVVGFETAAIPSAAKAAETPGTPGVDTSSYPKLVTQFGGTDVDLNSAVYTRFFYQPGTRNPDAILILIPGFEGGGNSFRVLAENLVTRARESGVALEVWGFDRRGHQLEDREGLHIAREALDAQIALDWYFGDELGFTLHPALVAGPNRRAIFHNAHEDTAFIANWTELVFSHDIDAVVDAARAAATGGNVFLGGHSAGTGFTARYAATDFNLSGAGPAEPGYAKLRGLVLLEGGGGSTSGTPPTGEDLDRIEDRADGGLFFAVRDDAPRCVDGTPCSVATEAADCAGRGKEKCIEPTEAYAVIPGLLNPRILASAEPGAVQGITDPDGGQVIIQVDQGAPGNSAVLQVPDLFILSVVIPEATAEGALGTFLDDDGFVSASATFVRTSVGAPGSAVGGLLTWIDITEGPLPPSVLPDNGPPPTTLPASEWGQEVEVVRMKRVGETFIVSDSNFTDWYYPSSGLGTTAGLVSLDSTPLSAGRGRTDIANLTQAADIDIPVICFGGSNGLTPVPGGYVPFASSIGTCAAPSCDGTPRVVDPASPNPAFPTLGGVAGGFEVHISEGLAHVDVVVAEDDSQSQIYDPLVDFLIRNIQ